MTAVPHDAADAAAALLRALYALGGRDLLSPSQILDVVRQHPLDEIEPDELAAMLEHSEQRVRTGLVGETAPPGWQWTSALLVLVLREAVAGRGVPVTWSTLAIARMSHARAWQVEHYGLDPNDDRRDRFVLALARLLRHSTPREWERALIAPMDAAEIAAPVTVGERIRRQRAGHAMTQEQLARALDVDRTTVVRWEHDERTPSTPQRDALAAVLGGTPATYGP